MDTPMSERRRFSRAPSRVYAAETDSQLRQDPRRNTFSASVLARSLSDRYSVLPSELREVNKIVSARLAVARGEGRDVKELSADVEEARSRLAHDRQLRRVQSHNVQNNNNRKTLERLVSASGRDTKSLSPEVEAARSEAAKQRLVQERERQQLHKQHLQVISPRRSSLGAYLRRTRCSNDLVSNMEDSRWLRR
jgi:predicted  nucleic acid-binding Zn-ribbon protein